MFIFALGIEPVATMYCVIVLFWVQVLVALIVGDVTQADDVTTSDVSRFKRQLYGGYLDGNYGDYLVLV